MRRLAALLRPPSLGTALPPRAAIPIPSSGEVRGGTAARFMEDSGRKQCNAS